MEKRFLITSASARSLIDVQVDEVSVKAVTNRSIKLPICLKNFVTTKRVHMTMSSFGKFYHLNPAGPTNFTERTQEYKGSSPKFVPNIKLSLNELITPISPETNRKLINSMKFA